MTQKIACDGVRWTCRVSPSAPDVPEVMILPTANESTIAVGVWPAGGELLAGAVLVEFSASSAADIKANDAHWVPAVGLSGTNLPGVVSEATLDVMPGPVTAVRVTAYNAGGFVEIVQGA